MISEAKFVRDVFEWDVGNWSRALAIWGEVLPSDASGAPALELGGRGGGLSLLLARHNYRVVCSDLETPQGQCAEKHQRWGYADRVTYASANALELPFATGAFAVVAFKSILGAVGRHDNPQNQRQAMREIYRVLRPEGVLLFAENLRATGLHEVLRRRFVKWGATWRYLEYSELAALLSEFSEVRLESCGFTANFGRSESQRQFLAAIDRASDRLLPSSWKYIGHGYAMK